MTGIIEAWPSLPFANWRDTRATLHLWTQVVGKIRLAQAPLINHWWQVPLYVTARGLSTSPMPHGTRTFQIDFDFIDHRLVIAAGDGATASLALEPRSVAVFHRQLMARLASLDLPVKIWTMPVEIAGAIPFEQDSTHASYDRDAANRFWRILVQCERVLTRFRAGFLGKVSPVHFFWGSFDLAVTRFSGRRAPPHTGTAPHVANWVMREAYSHEVSSVGFWPGDETVPMPAFYAYAYPEPTGFDRAPVRPAGAYWDKDMGEFILPYDRVREDQAPDDRLLEFCQSTYAGAADLARWSRAELERGPAR
ncbi:MAG TPA: DUF5996 family protein [Stellaceae bacterium]|nr:DUF5996 family protein [Stellaceae bacterium]